MNKITELFPDWNMMSPGRWSKHGFIIPCGDGDRKIEIGLYMEENESDYAGTYTLQVFDGDNVVVCAKVDPTTPDPATLTIDDRNYRKSITKDCPLTEYEEIKKGHWTVNTYNDGSDDLYDLGKCPYCGWEEDTRYIDLKGIKRCPSCGASLTFNRATITFSKK